MCNLVSKLKVLIRNYKFRFLQKYSLCNIKVNNTVYPVDYISDKNVKIKSLNINEDEVDKVTRILPHLAGKASGGYPFSKTLEYLVSLKLHDLKDGFKLLDAAGGAEAEFSKLAQSYTGAKISSFCQDSITVDGKQHSNIKYISGSIDNVPLDNGCIDGITCHHSFEHFAQNLDQKFISESLRLLKPGGKLVIVPLFITNIYSEITNLKSYKLHDDSAFLMYDSTASFAGWGPYEGFARTYDVKAFNERILSIISENHNVSVFKIFYNNQSAIDPKRVYYQPILNSDLKCLCIQKG